MPAAFGTPQKSPWNFSELYASDLTFQQKYDTLVIQLPGELWPLARIEDGDAPEMELEGSLRYVVTLPAEGSLTAFIPLMFRPGEAYQFDWSHEDVELAGKPMRVKVAHMRLCASRGVYALPTPRAARGSCLTIPAPS